MGFEISIVYQDIFNAEQKDRLTYIFKAPVL